MKIGVLLFSLVALLIVVVDSTDNEQCNTRYEYMNPERLEDLPDGKDVEVRCYDRGLWWVCPNPNDVHRATPAREQYGMGMYIQFKDKRIAQSDFDDCVNWNS